MAKHDQLEAHSCKNAGAVSRMRLSTIITICVFVLVLGDLFDSGTTAVALLNPFFAGRFVEVGDLFIMLFTYDLGLPQVTGFVIGLLLSWSIDVLIIYWTWHNSRSWRSWGSMPSFW